MSFLDFVSYRIKERGYEYYLDNNVIDSNQNNISEFEGIVKGTKNYHVKINIDYPNQSTCTCPYAKDHQICKHMVALYLHNFPNELDQCFHEEEYNEWDEEYDTYTPKVFEKPIYYDDLLIHYVDSLSNDELKDILLKELRKNEFMTYQNYLKTYENIYKLKTNDEIFFIL